MIVMILCVCLPQVEQYKDINGEFSIPEDESTTTTTTPGAVSTAPRTNDLAPAATDSTTTRPAVVQSVSPEANSPSSVTNGTSEQDNSSSPGAEDNASSSGDSGPSPERDSTRKLSSLNNATALPSKEEKIDTAGDDRVLEQKPVAMEVDETVVDNARTENKELGGKGLHS